MLLSGSFALLPFSGKRKRLCTLLGVALCSATTIKVLLKELGKTFLMVLSYHSSDRGWCWVLACFALRGFRSDVPYSVVKKTAAQFAWESKDITVNRT